MKTMKTRLRETAWRVTGRRRRRGLLRCGRARRALAVSCLARIWLGRRGRDAPAPPRAPRAYAAALRRDARAQTPRPAAQRGAQTPFRQRSVPRCGPRRAAPAPRTRQTEPAAASWRSASQEGRCGVHATWRPRSLLSRIALRKRGTTCVLRALPACCHATRARRRRRRRGAARGGAQRRSAGSAVRGRQRSPPAATPRAAPQPRRACVRDRGLQARAAPLGVCAPYSAVPSKQR